MKFFNSLLTILFAGFILSTIVVTFQQASEINELKVAQERTTNIFKMAHLKKNKLNEKAFYVSLISFGLTFIGMKLTKINITIIPFLMSTLLLFVVVFLGNPYVLEDTFEFLKIGKQGKFEDIFTAILEDLNNLIECQIEKVHQQELIIDCKPDGKYSQYISITPLLLFIVAVLLMSKKYKRFAQIHIPLIVTLIFALVIIFTEQNLTLEKLAFDLGSMGGFYVTLMVIYVIVLFADIIITLPIYCISIGMVTEKIILLLSQYQILTQINHQYSNEIAFIAIFVVLFIILYFNAHKKSYISYYIIFSVIAMIMGIGNRFALLYPITLILQVFDNSDEKEKKDEQIVEEVEKPKQD